MDDLSKILHKNQGDWDKCVQSMDPYTTPWLDLNSESLSRFAEGELSGFHEPCGTIDIPLLKKNRRLIYGNLRGKKVLCLASGGGQQSAVFSLLGASVTVADISQGQLNGDLLAASHYGYPIETVQCDMTDLSGFADGQFDIVYQPISICFVPDIIPVYREVHRVLKKGGIYTVAHQNPATYVVDFDNGKDGWDGIGYRIASPYRGGAIRMDESGCENQFEGEMTGEFRHLFIDIFSQLTESGFIIKYVWEDERDLLNDLTIVQRYFQILATKECD